MITVYDDDDARREVIEKILDEKCSAWGDLVATVCNVPDKPELSISVAINRKAIGDPFLISLLYRNDYGKIRRELECYLENNQPAK